MMGVDAVAVLKLVGFKLVRVSANFSPCASSHTHSFTCRVVAVEIQWPTKPGLFTTWL